MPDGGINNPVVSLRSDFLGELLPRSITNGNIGIQTIRCRIDAPQIHEIRVNIREQFDASGFIVEIGARGLDGAGEMIAHFLQGGLRGERAVPPQSGGLNRLP